MKTFSSVRRLAMLALALTGLCITPQAIAEDIDLYVGGEAATGAQTNVLIVLDNSTNWASASQHWATGKQGESELEALSAVIGTLGDNVNVGLLMAAGSNGGYVRFAIREMNGTNKASFQSMFSTMVTNFGNDGDNDDKVNVASIVYDNMLNAAFRYFNGKARFGTTDIPSGGVLDLRDYNGNSNSSTKQPAFPSALGNYSLASSSATTYTPPSSISAGCAKNFIIFIGNGYPNQAGASSDLTDAGALVGVTPDITAVSGGSARWADEWTRFMYTYGVKSVVDDPLNAGTKLWNKIATYTIDVCKDACESDQAVLLKSMAKVGGGKYFKSTSKTEIQNALALIFAEIQAVNSVFASATLPISVNTQGTYENQVYIGVFRPDSDAKPRWFGNLKEYKFGRYCDRDRNDKVDIDTTRALTSGIIIATHTGTASGTVTGSFSGNVTSATGTVTAVSGTVTGTVAGSTTVYLAAAKGTSAGTTGSPVQGVGSGTVTGTITGSGTGTGTSTFTGTFNDVPSVTGTYSANDERIGEDVAAPDCGSDSASPPVKYDLKLYLGDKNGYRAIDEEGSTGFIDLSAKSYWTSASTFWAATPNETAGSSDLADGPEVERGGAAQRMRTKWAGSATSPNPDGRKIYTCLGTCLAGTAGSAERTLSNNVVSSANSEVTTALTAPTGSATLSLARVGNTVTATSTAAHGFADAATVTIAGATPTDYNGAKTITYVDTTHFTYTLNEAPTITDSGTATKAGGTLNISSLTTSGTTATVVTDAAHGLSVGSQTTIANAAQSFLNGARTVVSVIDGFTFTYTFSTGTNPTNSTTHGSSAVGTQTEAHASITYSSTARCVTATTSQAIGCFLVESTSNLGNDYDPGATVTISGAVPTTYNGTWTITAVGSSCTGFSVANGNGTKYCVTLAAAAAAVSPDTGVGKTATGLGVSEAVTIARTLGATTATVTATDTAHTFANGDTIAITGATNSQYNVSGVIAGVTANTFTISGITVTPTTPPTGTITGTSGSGVAGPDTANLILWTRGKDLWEDEDGNSSLTNVRASIHGDVLHARPVVVNYGASIGIVGFYGSNDGYLRAISGGVTDSDGAERWAYLPTDAMTYSKLSRLYTNSETIRYPNTSCSISPTPTARGYVWDGPITAYQTSDGTSSTPPTKTWIFAAMRRGGRAIHALDVTAPDAPKLLWRISNTQINGTASTDYAELAQSWSEPRVIKLKGVAAGVAETRIALAFGAGYDASIDDKPTGVARTVTMGRGVFITDAETGARLHLLQAPTGITAYSFAADVSPLDVDNDGYIDRIYAVDTGGNVYRFDADQTQQIGSSGYWLRYIVATVGDIDGNGGANARKFLFAPEVLPFRQAGVLKVNVLVGSGDREKPLPNFQSSGAPQALTCSTLYTDTYYPPASSTATSTSSERKVNDRFFGLIDTIQAGTAESTANADPIVYSDLHQVNSSSAGNNTLTAFSLTSGDRGWQMLLKNDPDGNGTRNEEKVVNQARVVGGVAYFATNTPVTPNPSAGICSNLGEARGYAVDPFTGLPAFNRTDADGAGVTSALDYSAKFSGGGLPPTVTAGVVTIGGTPYRFIIGSGGTAVTSASSTAGSRNVITLRGTRSRLYWSYGADN